MSVDTTTSTITYTGNGSTSTAYVIPFVYLLDTHVMVSKTDSTGAVTAFVKDTDFALAGDGKLKTGTLTTTVAVAATDTITVYRQMTETQPYVFATNSILPAKTLEEAYDWVVYLIQEASRKSGGALRVSDEDSPIADLGNLESLKGKFIQFDSGTGLPTLVNAITLPTGAVTSETVTTLAELRTAVSNAIVKSIVVSGVITHDGGATVNVLPGQTLVFNTSAALDADNNQNAFKIDSLPHFTEGVHQIFQNMRPTIGWAPDGDFATDDFATTGDNTCYGGVYEDGASSHALPSFHGTFGGNEVWAAWFGIEENAPAPIDTGVDDWTRWQAAVQCGPWLLASDRCEDHILHVGDFSPSLSNYFTKPINLGNNWVTIEGKGRDRTVLRFTCTTASTPTNWPKASIVMTSNWEGANANGFRTSVKNLSITQSGDADSVVFWFGRRWEEGGEISDINIYDWKQSVFYFDNTATAHGVNTALIKRIEVPNSSILYAAGTAAVFDSSTTTHQGVCHVQDIWVNDKEADWVFNLSSGKWWIEGGKFENSKGVIRATKSAKVTIKDSQHRVVLATAWAGATAYAAGDIRTESNKSYICISAHTSDASTFLNDYNHASVPKWERLWRTTIYVDRVGASASAEDSVYINAYDIETDAGPVNQDSIRPIWDTYLEADEAIPGAVSHDAGDSTTVLTDSAATFPNPSAMDGWYVVNVTDDNSYGVIDSSTATTVTLVNPLTGGRDNTFQSGDTYRIVEHFEPKSGIGGTAAVFTNIAQFRRMVANNGGGTNVAYIRLGDGTVTDSNNTALEDITGTRVDPHFFTGTHCNTGNSADRAWVLDLY